MSFAKEMQDFLGAYKTVSGAMDDHAYKQTLSKYYEANTNDDEDDALDKEQKKANIAATNARAAATGASNALIPLRMQLLKAQIGSYSQQPPSAADTAGPVNVPTSVPAVGGSDASQGNDGSGDTPGYAAGGPVQVQQSQNNLRDQANAAVGGDPDDPQTNPMVHQELVQQQQAQPAIGGDDSDDSEDDGDGDDNGDVPSSSSQLPYSVAAAHDAVLGGMKYLHNHFGLNGAQAIQAGYRPGARGYARGAGAAPLDDMQRIYQKIDPNNQMSDSARNMAAMSAVWQFKLKQGDLQGAQRAAAMMLQHYRLASQRYAAISAAAANHGDIDAAAQAAMKAYANIPDGKNIHIMKAPNGQLQYSYTDENGQTINRGLVTPQQLAATAMGVATKGFDKFLLDAAGQSIYGKGQQGAVGGAGGGKPMKPQDRQTTMGAIGDAFDKQFTDDSGQPLKMPDEQVRAIKGSALRIVSDPQNTMTEDEAVNVAKRLSSPNAKNPDKPGFDAKPVDPDDLSKGYMVKLDKGIPVHVGEGDFDALADQRLEQQGALKKQKDAADAKAARPGVLDDTKKALSESADYADKNAPMQAFPGGASRDTSQAIPSTPDDDSDQPRQRPYVPFMAGGKQ